MSPDTRRKVQLIRNSARVNRSVPITTRKDDDETDENKNRSLYERRKEITRRLTELRTQAAEEFKARQPASSQIEVRFGGASTISAPSDNVTGPSPIGEPLSERDKIRRDFEERNRSLGAPIRDFARRELGGLGKFFFGESEESMRFGDANSSSYRNISEVGEEGFIDGIREDVKKRGLVRFLYQNILMEDEEKIRNNTAELQRQGYQYTEARDIATQYTTGDKDSIEDEVALNQLNNIETTRRAWAAVELLDITPIFSGFVKSAGKTYVRQTLERAMVAENAAAAREVLKEMLPDLAGTQAMEEVVALTQTMKDSAEGEILLQQIVRNADNTPVSATTEAQNLIYENGIPVLRGGAASRNVGDIVGIRDQIRAIVQGGREGRRLSTDGVLNDEISAGSLNFGTTADDTVDVFTTRSITNPSLGERVALTEGVARASLQGGANTSKISVKVDDLVRMDDGTFVYAPKKAVTENFSPQIKAVQEQSRQRVIDAEKMKAKLQRDIRTAERNLADADRRIARQQAEAVLKKEAERLRISKDVLETGKQKAAKFKKQIDSETSAATKAALDARKEARATIRSKQTQLNKLIGNVQKLREKREKLPEKYRKKIQSVQSGKTKVKVEKEDIPENIQQLEIEVGLMQDVVDSHPAKGLARYSARQGEFKGLLPEQKKDLDSAITEKSEGAYDSLEQARAGYQDYKTQKEVLSDMKSNLSEKKADWKAGAKKRLEVRKTEARKEAVAALQTQKTEELKELIKSEKGLEKGIQSLKDEVAEVKKSNPDVSKTPASIRAKIGAPAKARKKAIDDQTTAAIGRAKTYLKESGVDVKSSKDVKPSSFEAARQWVSGGNRRAMTKEVIEELDSANIKPQKPVTLYRIGDIDKTKFQSWSKKKPARGEEFTEKTFSPDQILIDTTDKRFVSQFTGTEREAIEQFNRVESEVIVKGKKRLTTKQVETINNAKTELKQGVKKAKEFEDSVPSSPKRNFDPIDAEGRELTTKMNEDIARRTGYEEGIPREYRQMNLGKDQQNAVKMVIEDPIAVYSRFIEGEDFTKATRASVGNALLSHPQIASSPFRMDEVYRALQGTRQAQEFVARRNIGDLDVVNFINNLTKRGDEILSKRGVDLNKEIEDAWKAAGLEKGKNQRAISRKSVEKVLKNNLC